MAIVRTTTTTWAQVNTWIVTNLVGKFLTSFTVDENNVASCIGIKGKKILEFKELHQNPGGSAREIINAVKVFNADGTAWDVGTVLASNYYPVARWCAICEHGALIHFSDTEDITSSANCVVELLITKNQNGSTAVICSKSGTSPTTAYYKPWLYTDLSTFSEDDTGDTRYWLQINQRNMQQLQLAPFCTNMANNATSYTPDAFMILSGTYSNIQFGSFAADGVTYMTNGYWAIRDE